MKYRYLFRGLLAGASLALLIVVVALGYEFVRYDGQCHPLAIPFLAEGDPYPCSFMAYLSSPASLFWLFPECCFQLDLLDVFLYCCWVLYVPVAVLVVATSLGYLFARTSSQND